MEEKRNMFQMETSDYQSFNYNSPKNNFNVMLISQWKHKMFV